MKYFALCALIAVAGPATARAADNPFNLPPQTDAAIKQVFAALFNEEFDQADRTLATIESQKDLPMVAMTFVVRDWWKLSLNVLETDADASTPFLQSVELCDRVCRTKMSDKRKSGQAAFAWGTTLGLMSRWSVSNHAWITAYVRGNKAVDACKKCLKKYPQFTDPYMTIGTINYAKNMLSNYMDTDDAKAAAVAKNKGLRQLKNAAETGVYFREASRLLLAGILTNDAPREAVPLLDQLHAELPRSAFVHMILMTALYNTGDLERLSTEAGAFGQDISTGTYPASYWPQLYFVQGLIAFRDKKWKEAALLFNEAVKRSTVENPYQAWSHLYRGYALDAWGKRKEAVKEYDAVLDLRRCFASHDHARARLQTPFKPTDPEMKKVEL
jgi:tetratricopeptide (TPR) repeat protein